MNGLEACRLIQQKHKNAGLEVLFVTQHDSPQMMREALDAGARGYVVKSNAARDLLEAVEVRQSAPSIYSISTEPASFGVKAGAVSPARRIQKDLYRKEDLP